MERRAHSVVEFWDINTRKWIHEHYWSSLLGPSQLNGGGEVSWFSTYWH